jgi:DNA-binding beta-propeller fold protein YncE
VSTYASVYSPRSIAIDAGGNMYVADSVNGRIAKIDAARNITYVGNVYNVYGVAVDSRGTIYATSYGTDQVFQIIGGTVTVLAGSGLNGYADGDANSAQFNRPYAVAVDSADNIFVADTNNSRIRQIKSSFVISLVQVTTGPPAHMVMDGAGNIYYTIPSLQVIMKRDTAGNVTTYAGSGSQAFADGIPGSFAGPEGLAIDSAGNIYVADTFNNAVRKIDTSGNVTTLFSGGTYPNSLNLPRGVAVDSSGIYVADTGNSRICSIIPGSVGPSSTAMQYVTTATGAGSARVYALMKSGTTPYIYSGKVGDSTYTYREFIRLGQSPFIGFIRYVFGPSDMIAVSATIEANAPPLSANVYWVGGEPLNIGDPLAVYTTFTNPGPPYTATLVAGFDEIGYIHITGNAPIYYNPGNFVWGSTIGEYPKTITIPSGTITVVMDSRVSNAFRIGTYFGYALDGNGNHWYVGAWLAIKDANGTYVCVSDSSWRRVDSFTGSTLTSVTIPGTVTPPSLNVIAGGSTSITVSTFAGGGSPGSADGTGTYASFNFPFAVALDSAGNIYVVDAANNKIRKITPAGVVTTFAGSGDSGSADGTGTAASFFLPGGVAVDSAGNIYVADTLSNKIRKITPAAVVTTLAGSGTLGSADGTGTAASFSSPSGVTVDLAGNIYVGDSLNNKIRKITPAAVVTTLAGIGTQGFDDGTGTSATFRSPRGIALDSAGNIYVADTNNHLIRKLTSDPLAGYLDANGTSAQFNNPYAICLDASHNIYVADTGNQMIRKVDPSANVTTVAGQLTPGLANGVGSAAQFNYPMGVAVDATNIYVADYGNNAIRKIDSTQKVTIYAGSPVGASGNSLTPPGLFDGPMGVFISGSYLYLTEVNNSDIKRMFGGTVVSTVASGLSAPTAIAFDSAGTMYVTDNHRVITIPNTAYAGTGSAGSADGIWSSATFNSPEGIAIDSAGIVYVADSGNNLLRKIAPSATNNTLFYANSTDIWRLTLPATNFYLTSTTNLNGGLAYDGTTIYATRDNSIYAYNTVTTASYTLAGSSLGYANGTSGVYFNRPWGLAIDSSGQNLYVCDYGNSAIRRVQISPLSVTTVASITNPVAIALDSYSRYAYVTNAGFLFGSVYRVSLLQGNTTQIVTGLGAILGITIDPTNTYAYIIEVTGIVIKINLQTFTIQTIAGSGVNASIDGISLAAAFAAPLGIIYEPTTALMYSTDYGTGLIRTITTPIYLSTILGLEVIRTAPTITGTLTISGATVGGLLYNSGGPTASASVIIGKGITLKTDLRAGNSTVTAKTFTASGGTSGGTNRGYYYGDGTYVTSISDLRTKEDIRPIRNALSIVRKLQAVEYTKRDDPTRRWIGYIAQDIEEVLPELVTTDDSPEKWKSVQYTNLPGLIIEAIKELKEKYRILSDIANAQSIASANAQSIASANAQSIAGANAQSIAGANAQSIAGANA